MKKLVQSLGKKKAIETPQRITNDTVTLSKTSKFSYFQA